MGSRQANTMWSGLPPGQPAIYEEKVNSQKIEAMASARLSNWAWYMQNQQGESASGNTANQVQMLTTASSGFPFCTAVTTASPTNLFTTLQLNTHHSLQPPSTTSSTSTNSFHPYRQGRSLHKPLLPSMAWHALKGPEQIRFIYLQARSLENHKCIVQVGPSNTVKEQSAEVGVEVCLHSLERHHLMYACISEEGTNVFCQHVKARQMAYNLVPAASYTSQHATLSFPV